MSERLLKSFKRKIRSWETNQLLSSMQTGHDLMMKFGVMLQMLGSPATEELQETLIEQLEHVQATYDLCIEEFYRRVREKEFRLNEEWENVDADWNFTEAIDRENMSMVPNPFEHFTD